jgi:hypothetical protein
MVRQSEALSAWPSFFDSPRLEGCRCGGVGSCAVWGFGVNRRQMGKRVAGLAPMACVACGRRGKGQAWGVVFGCGLCAVVEVYVAQTYKSRYMWRLALGLAYPSLCWGLWR